jgi:hypothetical protein
MFVQMKSGFRRKYCTLVKAVLIVMVSVSCRHNHIKPERAFYYWRSNFNLSAKDVNYMEGIGISKIYLHFFDVSYNNAFQKVLPVDEVKIDTVAKNTFQYIPVVFIANKALELTPVDSISSLCRHILNEVEHIATEHKLSYKELQFDCDWTDGTQKKYFTLLSYFHNELKQTGKLLSATIRLHQVKYKEKTGVPPVDRGMLMFYNMGKVNSITGYNSIYNERDADNYASYVKSYTLPLDVALPIFGWAVCIRDGKVTGIIEKAVNEDFSTDTLFLSAGNNIFVSRKALFLHGRYFMKNDTVKIEQATPDICQNAADNVSQYLKNEKRTVTLFDYDSVYLSTYDKKDLEKIFLLSN